MSDKILLSGVHLVCHIGVPAEERARAQGLIVDLEMGLDLRRAGASDRFEDTVDYAAVRDAMERVAGQRPYALVESLAESLAAAVLAEFAKVESVRVLVRKPAALAPLRVDWPGVEIVRTRNG
ncbi:MAG: dihydroneopterin aldolase [Acidobacteriota bacterium]